MTPDIEIRAELEKQRVEQRAEQLLRERKEKNENYLVQKASESNNQKLKEIATRKQMKLPLDDALYLNHDFDSREDFEQITSSSLQKVSVENHPNKQTRPRKAFHAKANYEHVQSVITSKKNESDLGSKKTQSNLNSESQAEMVKTHSESDVSVGGFLRTRRLERRKSIEAKFKNPFERDLMEMIEEDIEMMTETLASDSLRNLDIPKPLEKIEYFKPIDPEILKMHSRSTHSNLYKDYDQHLDKEMNTRLKEEHDKLDEGDFIPRNQSPIRQQSRGRRPVNSYSPQKQLRASPEAKIGAPAHQAQPKKPNQIKQDLKPQQSKLLTANRASDPRIAVEPAQLGPIHIRTFPQQPGPVPLAANQPETQPPRETKSQNGMRKTNFMVENKYTKQNNRPINEESNDNPFDKFDNKTEVPSGEASRTTTTPTRRRTPTSGPTCCSTPTEKTKSSSSTPPGPSSPRTRSARSGLDTTCRSSSFS